MKNVLITGGAGFIGSNLVDLLLEDPDIQITCVDNFDPFYNIDIKRHNIANHLKNPKYKLIEIDIRNFDEMKSKLTNHYDVIIHLAAKVGVRPSVKDPRTYTEVNVLGTSNILELARQLNCKKIIFASSSSVYGTNPNVPWKETDTLLLPTNPYGSSKISGELLGYVYSNLFNIQFIGLRFFTVFGPRQRPDLAIHKFAKLISQDQPIDLYGDGESERDYTYIDDITTGIKSALNYSASQYEMINLGNNHPIKLSQLIALLEEVLKKKAIIRNLPDQPGDLPITFADINKAKKLLNYKPQVSISQGLKKFADWVNSKAYTQ